MDAPQRRAVIDLVRAEIPSQVKVLEADHGQLELGLLLGHGAAAEDHIHLRPDHHGARHGPNGEHDHDHERFDSVVLTLPELPEAGLLERLEALVKTFTVYRVKGFVAVPNKPMRMVVHGVGRRFDRHYDRRWRADEARETRIVFIGEELDVDALRQELASALLAPA